MTTPNKYAKAMSESATLRWEAQYLCDRAARTAKRIAKRLRTKAERAAARDAARAA